MLVGGLIVFVGTPPVSVIKTRDIESALLRKGFRPDNKDHEYLWLFVGGKKTSIKTKLSYGIREYGDDLLAQVKKQLRLTKPQLMDLVECPMSEAAYVDILKKNGQIIV